MGSKGLLFKGQKTLKLLDKLFKHNCLHNFSIFQLILFV